MMNDRGGLRRAASGLPRRIAALAPLLLLLLPAGSAGEGVPTGPDRFSLLVEALDAESRDRERALGFIDNELRGQDAGDMHAALRDGLLEGTLLVRLGAAEALAMYADPRDVPLFRSVLETSTGLVNRVSMIRLLPAFALGNSERARHAYVRSVSVGDGRHDPGVTGPLRRPPLTRRGRLDQDLVRLRREISAILAGQFDPVGTAIAYVHDPVLEGSARSMVRRHVGEALGIDPGRWREIWSTHDDDFPLSNAEEIVEVVAAALQVLGDMGAPSGETAFPGIARLLGMEDPLVRQAALAALAEMCESAAFMVDSVLGGEYGEEWTDVERNWFSGMEGAAAALWLFTAREAEPFLASPDSALVRAAVLALGAAVRHPPAMAVDRPELAEMAVGVVGRLEDMALLADLDAALRSEILRALGKSGTDAALSAILEIMHSPYAGPEFGRSGLSLAEAGVGAVADIALGAGGGMARARESLLAFLVDEREYPAVGASAPPIRMGHLTLWRLQRIARTSEISFDPRFWSGRLGWDRANVPE